MVVNYDLPLLNERGGGEGGPDIETYIHRIGACLLLLYRRYRRGG